MALADNLKTARYWFAVGMVAEHCGKINQPEISVSPEDIFTASLKESGLSRSELIQVIDDPKQKRIIVKKSEELLSDVRYGYLSCADVILGFSASLAK
mgnify:CR=1 FL=1